MSSVGCDVSRRRRHQSRLETVVTGRIMNVALLAATEARGHGTVSQSLTEPAGCIQRSMSQERRLRPTHPARPTRLPRFGLSCLCRAATQLFLPQALITTSLTVFRTKCPLCLPREHFVLVLLYQKFYYVRPA